MTDLISPEAVLLFLKGVLLMIPCLVLSALMRRSTATFRHAMLASWLGALLLLPLASVLLPRWNLPIVGWLDLGQGTQPVASPGLSGGAATGTAPAAAGEATTVGPESIPSVTGQWLVTEGIDSGAVLLQIGRAHV